MSESLYSVVRSNAVTELHNIHESLLTSFPQVYVEGLRSGMQSEKGESLGLSEDFFVFIFLKNNAYYGTEDFFVKEFYDSKVFTFLFIFLCI